jgi:hypothetical protein
MRSAEKKIFHNGNQIEMRTDFRRKSILNPILKGSSYVKGKSAGEDKILNLVERGSHLRYLTSIAT